MEIQSMLALPKGFEVEHITIIEKALTIFLVSTQLHPCCPLCASQASHIHSRYRRHIVDLPCVGQEVHFVLLVRKFFCKQSTCVRVIFVERLTPFIEPWARVTTRLFQSVQAIGLATGGMLGTRLADRLGMETSWMTILRRMMALPTEPVKQVSQLGIDDFAFRRGHKYGTILVDMINHKVIDMLPDRTSATSATWMAAHPEIELVSRDRGGDYASAAREGAPQAIQCADRFHLLKNLGEALEGLLAHHLAAERKRQTQATLDELVPVPVWQPKRATRSSPQLEHLQQARREERLAQYTQVITLHKIGMSQQVIAERTGVSHSTISRWLAQGCFPERKPREQASHVDRYLPYLIQRWEDGCHNIAGLFRELEEQGYKGSYASVRDTIVRNRAEKCT
jgi:transposase